MQFNQKSCVRDKSQTRVCRCGAILTASETTWARCVDRWRCNRKLADWSTQTYSAAAQNSSDPVVGWWVSFPTCPVIRAGSAGRRNTSAFIETNQTDEPITSGLSITRPLKSLGAHRTVLPAFVFHARVWTATSCCVKLPARTEALCETTIHNRARQIPPAGRFF